MLTQLKNKIKADESEKLVNVSKAMRGVMDSHQHRSLLSQKYRRALVKAHTYNNDRPIPTW